VKFDSLQRALDARATAKTRDWWERYMKGVLPFRGVGIPVIREVVAAWRVEEGLDARPAREQFEVALALIRERLAEDKLAGVLYLQNYLVEEIAWKEAVPRYAPLLDDGFISDWNICDWFCVRVLGPTIAAHGTGAARAIAAWHQAENLWRARASLVAFVYLVEDERWHPLILRGAATLIRRDERFAKTAVGWVLRDLSKFDRERVTAFVDKHRAHFTSETFRNVTKYL
jgi:3-methyladenine DNA glycosylase AlkD